MSATDSDGLGRCKWCSSLTDSAGCLNLTCANLRPSNPVPPSEGDRVREAQHLEALAWAKLASELYLHHKMDCAGVRERKRGKYHIVKGLCDCQAKERAQAPLKSLVAAVESRVRLERDAELREAVKAMREETLADTKFCCPSCQGAHFGSSLDTEGNIVERECHDEFGHGCRWRGPDNTPMLFVPSLATSAFDAVLSLLAGEAAP
jgi:hypothetical protein